MSLTDPRLAWSVVLAPRRPDLARPAWPEMVRNIVGEVHVPAIDPMTRVLRGPFPVATLARGRTLDDVGFGLAGVGPSAVLTLVDIQPGEVEGHLRLDRMRARIASTLLGVELPEDGATPSLEATPARLGALLGEQFESDDAWELIGITEVCAVLSEGVAEDPPEADGYEDIGDLRIARAVGIGQGHAAFTLTGFHTRETARKVMERRLVVLAQGHQTRVPALAEYGAHALSWGRDAVAAQRLSAALAGVVADVRVAASWAVTGGPIDGGPPDLPRLAARLEMLRVRLKDVIGRLRRGQEDLRAAAARILGEGKTVRSESPFPEAARRGERLAERLEEEEQLAARWAEALEVARKSVER